MKDFKSVLEEDYVQSIVVTENRFSYEEYKEISKSNEEKNVHRPKKLNESEDMQNFCNDMYGHWLDKFLKLKREYFDIGFMNTASFDDLYNIINSNIKVEEIVEEIVEDEFETTNDVNLLS
jgi:hypothetical protein